MKTPLLTVEDLHVGFKMQKKILQAVRGISFTVHDQEILGIVGESGCGKSALAKAIVHLLPPHTTVLSGSAVYHGKNLLSLTDRQMQKIRGKEIGMVFQDPMTSLNPTKKIGNQIAEGYRLHHPSSSRQEAREYSIRLLELVGIPQASSRFDQYPHTLSGGMRQRTMIALALAPKPKLIIADEPTTALDVTIQAQILDLMRQIKDQMNTSFILITHDMSVVAGYCDRVLVMYAGRIVENASVDALFQKPSHPYTQGLLGSIPRLDMPVDSPLLTIPGSPPSLTKKIQGCSFYNRCAHAEAICKEKDPPHRELHASHSYECWREDGSSC